jgi:hypothetical protein
MFDQRCSSSGIKGFGQIKLLCQMLVRLALVVDANGSNYHVIDYLFQTDMLYQHPFGFLIECLCLIHRIIASITQQFRCAVSSCNSGGRCIQTENTTLVPFE